MNGTISVNVILGHDLAWLVKVITTGGEARYLRIEGDRPSIGKVRGWWQAAPHLFVYKPTAEEKGELT